MTSGTAVCQQVHEVQVEAGTVAIMMKTESMGIRSAVARYYTI